MKNPKTSSVGCFVILVETFPPVSISKDHKTQFFFFPTVRSLTDMDC